ncbi:MAG: 50S ribosomal protein L23 [bacterium]|nr:50S ribosomal protein L23 [bacterium]
MGLFDKLKKKHKSEKKTESKESAGVLVKKNEAKKEDSKVETKVVETKAVRKYNSAHSFSNKILVKPLISEKATIGEATGTYAFVVNNKANKFQVKEAIKEVYGILPRKVRILNVEGKRTNTGRRSGKRQDWKKAFVVLPKGKTINIHEGV